MVTRFWPGPSNTFGLPTPPPPPYLDDLNPKACSAALRAAKTIPWCQNPDVASVIRCCCIPPPFPRATGFLEEFCSSAPAPKLWFSVHSYPGSSAKEPAVYDLRVLQAPRTRANKPGALTRTAAAERSRPRGFHLKQGIETAVGCAPPAVRCPRPSSRLQKPGLTVGPQLIVCSSCCPFICLNEVTFCIRRVVLPPSHATPGLSVGVT